MRIWIRTLLAIVALGAMCVAASAQGKGQNSSRGQAQNQNRGKGGDSSARRDDIGVGVSVSFGSAEVRIIREWFSDRRNLSGLPPGLAKRESLPPGLQKQLQRNGSLPPGLEKKIQPLPRELEVRLPQLPDGRRRVVISGSVILMDKNQNRILDIVANVY
jgi:hypothetical protein